MPLFTVIGAKLTSCFKCYNILVSTVSSMDTIILKHNNIQNIMLCSQQTNYRQARQNKAISFIFMKMSIELEDYKILGKIHYVTANKFRFISTFRPPSAGFIRNWIYMLNDMLRCKHKNEYGQGSYLPRFNKIAPRDSILDGRWTRQPFGLSRVQPIYLSKPLAICRFYV